jgi:hypothetical protein
MNSNDDDSVIVPINPDDDAPQLVTVTNDHEDRVQVQGDHGMSWHTVRGILIAALEQVETTIAEINLSTPEDD